MNLVLGVLRDTQAGLRRTLELWPSASRSGPTSLDVGRTHVTETAESSAQPATQQGSGGSGGLSNKLLPELKAMAGGLGIKGASTMKKAQLVDAIRAAQSQAGQSGGQSGRASTKAARAGDQTGDQTGGQTGGQANGQPVADRQSNDADRQSNDNRSGDRQQGDQQRQSNQQNQGGQNQGGQNQGGNRRRRRRGRERQTGGGSQQVYRDRRQPQDVDIEVTEDDVLVPVAGILDILDNYAFVRTSGYLPGPNDVYVSLSMVRKYGLRKGDAVTGQVRQPREGERKEKFNPLVRIDTVNGADVDAAQAPGRVHQAHPAVRRRAAAPRDRLREPDRPRHRHRRADRQGPARPDRLAAQGRQDDDPAVDRQRDHRRTTPSAT